MRRLFLMLVIAAVGCASHQVRRRDLGILPCPASVQHALLQPLALQCWWPAGHGPWRILSHHSHYDALVVDVEVADVGDAREIASRLVADERATYAEILVYAHPSGSVASPRVRRIRWSRMDGFETLDFGAADNER